ncbi:hypothetical protein V1283_003041 [Bradyrhizobium sp. AZCC 2262]|uniref:hypothetical protein n=1 Tax=Bradyrhizobium sp. AZCC 2262 TaxID=3117022 RepID=UPI002FF29D22
MKRRGKDTDDLGDEEAIAELEKTVMEANVAELTGALARLREFLCDFQALHDAIEKQGRGMDELALAKLASGTTPIALLRKPSTDSQTYFFRCDYDGNELASPPPLTKTTVPLREITPTVTDINALVDFGREVVGAMNQLGLTFSDLSGIGLLPPGLSQSEAVRVIGRLRGPQQSESRTSSDLIVLRNLTEAFAARGTALGWAIDLALDVARDAGLAQQSDLPSILRAMARFLDFESLAMGTDRMTLDAVVEGQLGVITPPPPAPTGDTEGMRAWRQWLAKPKDQPTRRDTNLLVDDAWRRWEGQIGQFIKHVTVPDTSVVYDDLVLAAADKMPSRAMRASPERIEPLDWSELALAGIRSARPWAFLAGLRQQAFGNPLLADTLRGFAVVTPDPDWVSRLVQDAPPAQKGILVILSEDTEPLERDDPGPYLFLREARIEEYDEGVRRLKDLGAFRMVIDER